MDTIDPPWPDLEATQPIEPLVPKKASNVIPFDMPPYRITPEMVVRQVLSQLDLVEDVLVVFRVRGKPGCFLNYSSEISGTDLAVAAITMQEMAVERLKVTPANLAPDTETRE